MLLFTVNFDKLHSLIAHLVSSSVSKAGLGVIRDVQCSLRLESWPSGVQRKLFEKVEFFLAKRYEN